MRGDEQEVGGDEDEEERAEGHVGDKEQNRCQR
jgi:hypothetical protein